MRTEEQKEADKVIFATAGILVLLFIALLSITGVFT